MFAILKKCFFNVQAIMHMSESGLSVNLPKGLVRLKPIVIQLSQTKIVKLCLVIIDINLSKQKCLQTLANPW